MNVIFRNYANGDLPLLQPMVNELYATDIGDSDAVSPDIGLTIEMLKSRPDCGNLVVIEADGGALAGYAILIFFWSNEFGGFFIEIDELFVEDSFRGQGIGSSFFSWLEEEYKDRKIAAWSLQVSQTNAPAQRLYESLGFKRSSSYFLTRMIT